MKTRIMLHAVVGVFCLAVASGCATSGGTTAKAASADPKVEVTKVLGEWGSALATKNLDSIMTFYSDSFKDGEGRDKMALKDFIKGAIDQGYLDGAKVDVAAAQVSVNGAEAVVAPVSLSGNMGEISLSLSLKKEANGWRIVSSGQA